MNGHDVRSVGPIVEHPILMFLASFPIAYFCGALATDIAYARSANMMWAEFSAWLLAVGFLIGLLAAVAGAIHLVANRRVVRARRILPFAIGCGLVLILAFFDNLVHSRDAWTSVVPLGLALSAVTVAAILVTIVLGSSYGLHYAMGAESPDRMRRGREGPYEIPTR